MTRYEKILFYVFGYYLNTKWWISKRRWEQNIFRFKSLVAPCIQHLTSRHFHNEKLSYSNVSRPLAISCLILNCLLSTLTNTDTLLAISFTRNSDWKTGPFACWIYFGKHRNIFAFYNFYICQPWDGADSWNPSSFQQEILHPAYVAVPL